MWSKLVYKVKIRPDPAAKTVLCDPIIHAEQLSSSTHKATTKKIKFWVLPIKLARNWRISRRRQRKRRRMVIHTSGSERKHPNNLLISARLPSFVLACRGEDIQIFWPGPMKNVLQPWLIAVCPQFPHFFLLIILNHKVFRGLCQPTRRFIYTKRIFF